MAGCSGNTFTRFPDTPTEISPGAVQGSVFGGHAPIVGAHVYVLEAGQTGYASSAVSKLTHGDGTDSIGTYVLTNGSGFFNITGDYSCDYSATAGGNPVYLAASGGSPDQSLTAAITSASAVGTGFSGHNPPYTITFAAVNLFYAGQSVTFPATGFPGALTGNFAVLNGTTQVVTSATASQFVIVFTTTASLPTGATTGSATSVGIPNPAIINLAVLGLCPGVTNEFATTLSFVFMNEVSTVAAAEALGGFGTGPYKIGSSGTNLVGIQNAAVNAGQLYDIQGSNVTTTTPYDGEGHIARSATPAGNGQVPQSTLDTLGNILASCVDSNNSANSSTDPTSTGSPNASVNCSQLFTYATSNGIPFGSTGAGTIATDTATAAFNIAHYPSGAAAYSSGSGGFMQKIYALQASEATPFTPNLTTVPNDFSIAINYPNSLNTLPVSGTNYLGQAESLGVDGTGNVWFSAQTQKILFKWSPVGVLQNYTTAGYIFGYLSIDPSGDAWSGNANSNTVETEVSPTGVLLSATPPPVPAVDGYTGPYNTAYTTVTDQYGDALIGSKVGGQSYLTVLFSDGQFFSQTNLHNTTLDPTFDFEVPPSADTAHGAIDSGYDLWINSEAGNQIDRLDLNAGHSAAGFPIVLGSNTQPEFPGLDHANNAWIALQLSNTIDKVTPAGVVTNPTGSIYLNHPFGSAVDGIGNVWIANRQGSGNNGSIVEINGATSAAISPAANYTLGNVLNGSLNLAIDPSGDLWITNYGGSGSITELIGPVAPVATPLSTASGNNTLGTEP